MDSKHEVDKGKKNGGPKQNADRERTESIERTVGKQKEVRERTEDERNAENGGLKAVGVDRKQQVVRVRTQDGQSQERKQSKRGQRVKEGERD